MTLVCSYEQACARLLFWAKRISEERSHLVERVVLDDIGNSNRLVGRVISEDVFADFDFPNADLSAMDGYAVRDADVRGIQSHLSIDESEVFCLQCVGEIAAGESLDIELESGQCAAIYTGGALPRGCDRIIVQENVREICGDRVCFDSSLIGEQPEDYIRRKGRDFHKNDLVIAKGEILNARKIGLLAALGRQKILLSRQLSVSLLAVGDELVPLGQQITGACIHPSSLYLIKNFLLELGFTKVSTTIVGDDPDLIRQVVGDAVSCSGVDLVVSLGGASKGRFDFMSEVVEKLQLEPLITSLSIKPGKPFKCYSSRTVDMDRRLRHKLLFVLPGNIVSSYVTSFLFLRPFCSVAMGSLEDGRAFVFAKLSHDLKVDSERQSFMRAEVRYDGSHEPSVAILEDQDSYMLFTLSKANSLVFCDAGSYFLGAGDTVRLLLIEPRL